VYGTHIGDRAILPGECKELCFVGLQSLVLWINPVFFVESFLESISSEFFGKAAKSGAFFQPIYVR
jgi:hypothetical protein